MAINASSRRYFDEIDVVKGIAILTVLWHHSMIRYPIYMLDIPWCRYARHIFFVWMLSFRILKYKRISRLLAFAGRYSLPYYWLNGFALVVARALIVSVLHVSFTPMIAICIFLICVVLETVGILAVRRWPYVRCLIGIK